VAHPFELSLPEVKQLWWWLRDGAVMSPPIRQQLRHGWGLCPRHTWAHLAVECELRRDPLSTAGLYLDLIERAARVLQAPSARRSRLPASNLVPRADCPTCAWISGSTAPPDASFADRQQQVNRLERTRRLLQVTRVVWAPRSCPSCTGGAGIPCRPHLLATAPGSVDRGACADELTELAGRLGTLVASMTLHGPTATQAHRAALVEALGWFAGWGLAEQLARTTEPAAG
jgi:hypothetical protein